MHVAEGVPKNLGFLKFFPNSRLRKQSSVQRTSRKPNRSLLKKTHLCPKRKRCVKSKICSRFERKDKQSLQVERLIKAFVVARKWIAKKLISLL